jgi:hypothetical protein
MHVRRAAFDMSVWLVAGRFFLSFILIEYDGKIKTLERGESNFEPFY